MLNFSMETKFYLKRLLLDLLESLCHRIVCVCVCLKSVLIDITVPVTSRDETAQPNCYRKFISKFVKLSTRGSKVGKPKLF